VQRAHLVRLSARSHSLTHLFALTVFWQITVGHQLDALSQLRRYDDIRQLLKTCASQRLRSGRPVVSRAAVMRFQYSLQVHKFDRSFCMVGLSLRTPRRWLLIWRRRR
jgi:hypothetical protein